MTFLHDLLLAVCATGFTISAALINRNGDKALHVVPLMLICAWGFFFALSRLG